MLNQTDARPSRVADAGQASDLENLFKLLANDSRLRLLHAIARHEECAWATWPMNSACHRRRSRISSPAAGIVAARRDGNNIHYRIVDPCVADSARSWLVPARRIGETSSAKEIAMNRRTWLTALSGLTGLGFFSIAGVATANTAAEECRGGMRRLRRSLPGMHIALH